MPVQGVLEMLCLFAVFGGGLFQGIILWEFPFNTNQGIFNHPVAGG